MPKKISHTEFSVIQQAVRRLIHNAAINDIYEELNQQIPRRTLQRRLAFMVTTGQLQQEGKGRGSRYRLPANVDDIDILQVREQAARYNSGNKQLSGNDPEITLSTASVKIQQHVRQPLHCRKPVGYNRQFLDTYKPNRSFYLSDAIRKHLLQIGQSNTDKLPAGTHARKVYNRLLIDLSWNSSRLEGNTYSLLETERLLAMGDTADGKNTLETQMILNHKAAIELLVDCVTEMEFNHHSLCNLHALLAENLLPSPAACGRLREEPVGIGGSTFQPLQGGILLRECFDELLNKARAIRNPFEQAFFAMVHLPYLQPFDDVNKRVSRLAANIPLIRENLSPLSFVDLPARIYIDGLLGIYEMNRTELFCDLFVWAYERSCARYSAVRQALGEPDPFRLRYREQIAKLVADIVTRGMDKKRAVSTVKHYIMDAIPNQDREQFFTTVETELISLHEGNIARYRIRLSQFRQWQEHWQ